MRKYKQQQERYFFKGTRLFCQNTKCQKKNAKGNQSKYSLPNIQSVEKNACALCQIITTDCFTALHLVKIDFDSFLTDCTIRNGSYGSSNIQTAEKQLLKLEHITSTSCNITVIKCKWFNTNGQIQVVEKKYNLTLYTFDRP